MHPRRTRRCAARLRIGLVPVAALAAATVLTIPDRIAAQPDSTTAALPASAPAKAAATPAGTPLYAKSGDAADARWIGFDAAGAPLFQVGTQRRAAPWGDLVRFGRVRPVQLRSGQVLVSLAGGGRVVGRISALDARVLILENAALGTIRLPRAEVAALWQRLRFEAPGRDERTEEILAATADRDALFLEDGDRRTGKVLGWEVPPPEEIRSPGPKFLVELEGEKVRVEASDVEVVRFAAAAKRSAASKDTPQAVWIGLADGSVFPAASVTADPVSQDGALVRPECARDATWKLLSLSRGAFLQPRGYGAAYLSDLPIVKPRQVPLWNEALPPQADRNVLGRALRSGGAEYLKGLGVCGALALSYPIRPEHKKFQALAVIDDEAGLGGSATLQVLVDGKSKYASPVLRGGDPAAPVSVEVAGGKVLTLVVLLADRGPVQDYLDLIDARLSE